MQLAIFFLPRKALEAAARRRLRAVFEGGVDVADPAAGARDARPEQQGNAGRQFCAARNSRRAVQFRRVVINGLAEDPIVDGEQRKQSEFGPEPWIEIILLRFGTE